MSLQERDRKSCRYRNNALQTVYKSENVFHLKTRKIP